MKRKISLVLLCGVILLGVCGCSNKIEKQLKNNSFTYELDDVAYINDSFTFYDNGNCKKVYQAGLNGKTYKTTENDCTYTVEEDTITINVDDKEPYIFEYDFDKQCLIDIKDQDEYCK